MYHLHKVGFFVFALLFIKVFQTCNKTRHYGILNPKYAQPPASIIICSIPGQPCFTYRHSAFLSCHFEGEPRIRIFFVNTYYL